MAFRTLLPICCLLIFNASLLIGQNTVGVLSYTSAEKYSEGYNIIYPHYQSDVFLLNTCGEIVHMWEGPEGWRNNNTAYLLENGDLIRTLRKDEGPAFIWEDSGTYNIECRSWENELKWTFENPENSRLHHDFEPTPYGTILIISWDHYSLDEAIDQGRDSLLFTQEAFSPDKIIEYDPSADSIIWEWKAWDHLIQDRDPDKPNYGIVADHPERIDINWENNQGFADWMHVNSIDYHPELDQIMINVPTFNEIWIIDHSTTTEEASGSSGGNSGMGGDLLWRWGNPMTYHQGDEEDQKLFFQHDALWALDYLDESNPDFGKISIFNNQKEEGFSYIGMIEPTFDPVSNRYLQSEEETFLPLDFYYEWSSETAGLINSSGLSSVQILPNDNKLICSGRNGISLELTPDEEVVWLYKTPYRNGFRVPQGTVLNQNDNFTFRIRRIPESFSAFENRILDPIEYLELDPDETYCERLLDVEVPINAPSIEVIQLDGTHLLLRYNGTTKMRGLVINTMAKKIQNFNI